MNSSLLLDDFAIGDGPHGGGESGAKNGPFTRSAGDTGGGPRETEDEVTTGFGAGGNLE